MKAAYYEGNRSFRIAEAEPVPPGPGEVRLDVAYCGICGTDIHIYHGAMDKRVKMPAVIGHEMSGRVAEVGDGVSDYNVGDPVVVRPLDMRKAAPHDRGHDHIARDLKFMGIDSPGAFQQSWTVPANTLHRVSANVPLKLAALTEPLAVACHDVRLANVKPGELAVVMGGGPIGMLVALVAKEAGASVILSEINPFRRSLAGELGIESIDPKTTDLVQLCKDRSDNAGADLVFEVSGAKAAALAMTDPLALRGRIVVVAVYPQPVEVNLFQFFWKELSLQGARVYESEDYERSLELLANQSLPVEQLITGVASLDELPDVFSGLEASPDSMKTLIACNPSAEA